MDKERKTNKTYLTEDKRDAAREELLSQSVAELQQSLMKPGDKIKPVDFNELVRQIKQNS